MRDVLVPALSANKMAAAMIAGSAHQTPKPIFHTRSGNPVRCPIHSKPRHTYGAVAAPATHDAPYVWRGLEWIGHRTGLPDLVWKMGFGVWWALPAIIAAAILFAESAGTSTSRIDLNKNIYDFVE